MKWTFIILFIIIIFLLISKIKIQIMYLLNDGKNEFQIKISYLFGLIKYNLDNCSKNNNIDLDKKKEEKNNNLKLREHLELIKYIKSKIIIDKLVWKTNIGLVQPNYLSFLYVFIWWIKSFIINCFRFENIGNVNINVIPYYNVNRFGIYLDCIIKIRMVNIINIWIRYIKLYKDGEKNDRTSNRRINEDYNE